MADLLTLTCDECGAIRRAANHWFRAYLLMPGIFIVPLPAAPPAGVEKFERRDLCSHSCIAKLTSRALGAE